jgi:DNA polymerase-3 subunit beta
MLDTTQYMQCKVTVQDILPMLALMGRIVEKRNTIPILANICFRGDGTVAGTDLDLEVTWKLDGTDGVHPFTVPLHTLQKAVKGAGKGGFIQFDLEAVDDEPAARVTITVDGLRSSVNALPESDFPYMVKSTGDPVVFRMPQADLYSWWKFIEPCISDEETRYYLNGIYVHPRHDMLSGVATDGHKLALLDAPGEHSWSADGQAPDAPGVIVPTKTVKTILATLGAKATGACRLTIDNSRITLTTTEFTLRSKVIDATFPDYTRVIPDTSSRTATFDPAEMKTAVARIAGITDKRQAIKITPAFSAVEARYEGETHSMTVDFIGAEYHGDSCFGVNAAYMQEVCGTFAALGAKTVDMGYGTGDPMRITAQGIEGVRVVMPVRLAF